MATGSGKMLFLSARWQREHSLHVQANHLKWPGCHDLIHLLRRYFRFYCVYNTKMCLRFKGETFEFLRMLFENTEAGEHLFEQRMVCIV